MTLQIHFQTGSYRLKGHEIRVTHCWRSLFVSPLEHVPKMTDYFMNNTSPDTKPLFYVTDGNIMYLTDASRFLISCVIQHYAPVVGWGGGGGGGGTDA